MLKIAQTSLLILALSAACRPPEPHTEEIFQAQTLGLGYLDRGQLADAETQFKKVVSLAPNEALGHANLGLTYLRASRFSDAESELKRARELDPNNADIALMTAKLYAVNGRVADARSVLAQATRTAPNNPHVLYALAELDRQAAVADSTRLPQYEQSLRKALDVAPLNVALRLQLADAELRRGRSDSALRQLEEMRRVGPELPAEARSPLDTTIQRLQTGKATLAREPFDRFQHAMTMTSGYQTSLSDVKWLEGPLTGTPTLSFMPKSLSQLRGLARGNTTADQIRFVDATNDAGLPGGASPSIAIGDVDGDGTDDIFVAGHLYHVQGGQLLDVTQRAGISVPGGVVFATFFDADNDGRLDLFVIGGDQVGHLFHNTGGNRFEDVTAKAAITKLFGARKAVVADFDHDGDLDLLLVGGGRLAFYRNNADGTFTEMADAAGLSGTTGGDTRDAAFADFDGDGRLDVLVVTANGAAMYHNDGGRRFSDVTAKAGLSIAGGSAVVAADYDNDGFIDVLALGAGEPSLWLNNGNGTFRRDSRSSAALKASRGTATSAEFVDYDNDGWLDLVVVGQGAWLLRNDGHGKFEDRATALPATVKSGSWVQALDLDADGDLDLLVGDQSGVRYFRNDGGNARLSMQVRLTGLRTGSGKNNDFGIGAKVEVRAGELYQTRVVTSDITHFGLGSHLKADVVRIEWPNGVPQTVFFPGSDQDVIENEVLKGSCAFLYTWDGNHFRFVTDVMWRSALGMPLGLMAGGSATAYAPAGASQEYLRIPGDALKARDGKYTLQLTEELWETAFADEIKLLAVDHPDSVQVFVDERFVPPGPVDLRLYRIAHARSPKSAVDDRGNDVLPLLIDLDDQYVSNLTPLEYQGVVEPHDLVLDLDDDAGADSTYLFLRGWIYPTDASINVALSQQSRLAVSMPSLQVRDTHGAWVTAIPNLSFPSGKSKTLVVPLGGIFPASDHHVRIRTNLQIYWDQAFTGRDVPDNPARVSPLRAASANLHFRGYSRTYRKGGRHGPWWFDYDSVRREPPWRPIEGAFTRFGDVLSLFRASDDMYVIMAPGDEATLEFDAASAPPTPTGWTRDFLLYTDGWIKDSDLNTAYGTTVEPLPFHAIKSYPYAPGDAYPTDSVHARYRREFNTRVVNRRGLAAR
ncbi:MAG TPA: FG-GAP-like repeat-containing protein [Gemmatimonadaceae bacterium]|nr:FG-GAP-like repeat-containing protein [Gemmatimonadaceae bacterium]